MSTYIPTYPLTSNDCHLGPITFGKSSYTAKEISFCTGGGEESYPHNHLKIYGFGYAVRIRIPAWFKSWKQWVDLSHYDWAQSDGYWQEFGKEYGVSFSDGGFFRIFYGPQTGDSETEKCWSCFLPWTQWKMIGYRIYDRDGNLFWSDPYPNGRRPKGVLQSWDIVGQMSHRQFVLEDYDGEQLIVTTYINEREWSFGEKWCSWLKWFRPNRIRRSLDIRVDKEMGPEKGSWKGGTIGTGIDMLPNETQEQAIRRFCEQEHYARHNRAYKVKFISTYEDSQPNQKTTSKPKQDPCCQTAQEATR